MSSRKVESNTTSLSVLTVFACPFIWRQTLRFFLYHVHCGISYNSRGRETPCIFTISVTLRMSELDSPLCFIGQSIGTACRYSAARGRQVVGIGIKKKRVPSSPDSALGPLHWDACSRTRMLKPSAFCGQRSLRMILEKCTYHFFPPWKCLNFMVLY